MSEPQLSQEALDALPQQLAVLDRDGVIRLVNRAWLRFARDNDHPRPVADAFVGHSYLAVLAAVRGDAHEVEQARRALDGIRAVLAGSAPRHTLEYPCPSPQRERWFIADVSARPEGRGAVITHTEITARKQGEIALQGLSTRLEARSRAHGRFLEELMRHDQALQHELDGARARLALHREAERLALARELHDGVLQQLLALHLHLGGERQWLRRTVETDAPAVGERLDRNLGWLQDQLLVAAGMLRRSVHHLRPIAFEQVGLAAALRELGRELHSDAGPPWLDLELREPAELAQPLALSLYRVAQEALRNVARHAQARRVTVRLEPLADHVRLSVHDDGRGFRVPEHLGLLARSERFGLLALAELLSAQGGSLEVRSEPGRGTRVTAVLPTGAHAVRDTGLVAPPPDA